MTRSAAAERVEARSARRGRSASLGTPDGGPSRGVAELLVRSDAQTFTVAFKDATNSSGDVIVAVLARQILSIRENHSSRARAPAFS